MRKEKERRYKERRRRIKKRRQNMAVVGFVVLLLCGMITFKKVELNAKALNYKQQLAELRQEKQTEKKRAEQLEDYKEYIKSQEYIEKTAREKLGLVYPDEIIFRAENK